MKRLITFALAFVFVFQQTSPAGGVATGTSTGQVPLDELGVGTYLGETGGLYPGGSNIIPQPHFAAGQALAQQVEPLDAVTGLGSGSGKIGVLCLGMSNSSFIFMSMIELLVGQTAPNVVFVQAAKGGYDLRKWQDPNNVIWPTTVATVNSAGITPAQVQVVLQTHSMANTLDAPQAWPATPKDVQAYCENTMRNVHLNFPNAKLCFWSSREYAGYTATLNNPEPYAYQSGFAVKWMIEKQISGDPTLNFDPSKIEAVQCPWMAWGPYIWGDGLTPRADGMFWEIRDFNSDGVHPSVRGRTKAGAAWARFLLTNPLTAPWLRAPGNRPPMVKVIGPTTNLIVEAEGRVAIEAHAEDIDGTVARVDFMQGNTLLGSDTTAPYSFLWTGYTAGDYVVKAVAFDDLGASTTSFPVTLLLRDPVTGSGNGNGTVASDNFESSDYVGGAGWEQQGWALVGNPVVTTALSPPEGTYQAQLRGGESITRSVDLSGVTSPSLVFKWRGQIPPGYTFVVENIGSTTQTLLTLASQNVSTAVTETIPLSALNPGAGFSIRFRVTGPANSANLLLDDIRIITPVAASPAVLTLALRPTTGTDIQLIGSAAIHKTYTVESSADLITWAPLYHTTAIEDGTYTIREAMSGARGFFRAATPISP